MRRGLESCTVQGHHLYCVWSFLSDSF